jgi:hypothetical protein
LTSLYSAERTEEARSLRSAGLDRYLKETEQSALQCLRFPAGTHGERSNRTIEEEFIDYHEKLLITHDEFNRH